MPSKVTRAETARPETGPLRGGAPESCARTQLALTLSGGGARAAYQVGVLRALARHHPGLEIPFLTGISAGAINIAHLANHTGSFEAKTVALEELWQGLDVGQVFETRSWALFYRSLCVLVKLAIGWAPSFEPIRGLVDTRPLREFLEQGLSDPALPGIRENLAAGRLQAVALIALRYATGQTISFCEGGDFQDWERPMRRNVRTELSVDHVLASSSLPLFFPAVEIGGDWYGDGGVRLTAPLAPAIHLGARRILAISTRYRPSRAEADVPRFEGPPAPAQIAGNLFSAIFLDVLDQDALMMERFNRLVRRLPEDKRDGLREVELLVVRPSEDLGRLANEFEPRLPGMLRFLTRRWGTKGARSQELLSTILFQEDYIRLLIEIGERDGEARAEDFGALLES